MLSVEDCPIAVRSNAFSKSARPPSAAACPLTGAEITFMGAEPELSSHGFLAQHIHNSLQGKYNSRLRTGDTGLTVFLSAIASVTPETLVSTNLTQDLTIRCTEGAETCTNCSTSHLGTCLVSRTCRMVLKHRECMSEVQHPVCSFCHGFRKTTPSHPQPITLTRPRVEEG